VGIQLDTHFCCPKNTRGENTTRGQKAALITFLHGSELRKALYSRKVDNYGTVCKMDPLNWIDNPILMPCRKLCKGEVVKAHL
jgi:hypothetical protein